jgi:acyl carrier protein
MADTAIYDKLVGIIRDVLDDYDTPITLDTKASDVQGWDSVNHINIIVAVEGAFGIKFRTAELEKMKNVGELVALIQQKTNVK